MKDYECSKGRKSIRLIETANEGEDGEIVEDLFDKIREQK